MTPREPLPQTLYYRSQRNDAFPIDGGEARVGLTPESCGLHSQTVPVGKYVLVETLEVGMKTVTEVHSTAVKTAPRPRSK